MGLTLEQSEELRNKVLNIFKTKQNCRIYAKTLVELTREEISFECSDNAIYGAVKNLQTSYSITKGNGTCNRVWYCYTYHNNNDYIIIRSSTELMKKRNKILFPANKEFYFDFETGDFNIPLSNKIKDLSLNSTYQTLHYLRNLQKLKKYEWIFNFFENTFSYRLINELCDMLFLNDNSLLIFIEKEPKGFLAYLKANNFIYPFSAPSVVKSFICLLLKYIITEKYTQNIYLSNYLVEHYDARIWYLKAVTKIPDFNKMVSKIAVASAKDFTFDHNIETFFKLAYHLSAVRPINDIINCNRSFTSNTNILSEIGQSLEKTILSTNLQKLNLINGLKDEVSSCQVVVPQSQEDNIEEGKQQHNCVGNHYNNKILRGEDFIYFIRKCDNIKKSYITCRFNINSKNTIEYKGVNNSIVYDSDVISFIQKIDRIINENIDKLY